MGRGGGTYPNFLAMVQPSLQDRRSIWSCVPGVGNAGLFSVVPPGLGSLFTRLIPDLRPGLSYAAAPRLELTASAAVVSCLRG